MAMGSLVESNVEHEWDAHGNHGQGHVETTRCQHPSSEEGFPSSRQFATRHRGYQGRLDLHRNFAR